MTQVLGLVLSLGSNLESAQKAFERACLELAKLGKCQSSDRILGRDFTGKSCRIYHNACLFLELTKPMDLQDLKGQLKHIEMICGRDPAKNNPCYDYEVAMDIDILAKNIDGIWFSNPKKTPLKPHDRVGVQKVAAFLLSTDE